MVRFWLSPCYFTCILATISRQLGLYMSMNCLNLCTLITLLLLSLQAILLVFSLNLGFVNNCSGLIRFSFKRAVCYCLLATINCCALISSLWY